MASRRRRAGQDPTKFALELLRERMADPSLMPDDAASPGYLFASRLERMVIERIGRRQTIEDRWYRDAQQYAGRYDEQTLKALKRRKGSSQLFLNMTRPKTAVLRARIADVMLPEDEPNWDIKSSPVPDLPEEVIMEVLEELEQKLAEEAEAEAAEQQQQQQQQQAQPPAEDPQAQADPGGAPPPPPPAPPPPPPEPPPAKTIHDISDERVFQALKNKSAEIIERAKLVMRDQLNACNYAREVFMVIHDAAKFGTGVLKGPLIERKSYKRWARQQALDSETGTTETTMSMVEISQPQPVFRAVHVGDWYPDPEASNMDECEDTFERHRWSKTQLRKNAKKLGFNRAAVNKLLRQGPSLSDVYNSFMTNVRDIELGDQRQTTNRYHVWEYRGPPDADELRAVLQDMPESDQLAYALGFRDEDGMEIDLDLMDVPNIVCYFSQGLVLLLEPDVLDNNEPLYSVFTLDPEESSMYGDGIPAMVEHPQRALNAGWRLTMDNAGLAGLPMYIVDEGISPVDGPYEIVPGKLWRRNSTSVNSQTPGIEVVQIAASIAEGLEIVSVARQLMSDESMVPLIAQGESSGATQQTAHGMTLLVNSVNTTFRQIVRSFDLNLTVPTIRRLYQWNRQYGPSFIQGDAEIIARGSSVLLVREVQASQRMTALNLVINSPDLADYVNLGELFKLLLQAMQLPTDRILYPDDVVEVRREQRLAAEQAAAQSADEGKLQVEQLRQEGAQMTEDKRRQTEQERLQVQQQIAEDKNLTTLEQARLKSRSDERKVATEVLIKRQEGSGI